MPPQPSRPRGDELLAADSAWRALHQDSSGLLAGYRSGAFRPGPAVVAFAGDVARLAWTENSLRAAARTAHGNVRAAGLAGMLDQAAVVLRAVPADDRALLPLRQLFDALAHATPAAR